MPGHFSTSGQRFVTDRDVASYSLSACIGETLSTKSDAGSSVAFSIPFSCGGDFYKNKLPPIPYNDRTVSLYSWRIYSGGIDLNSHVKQVLIVLHSMYLSF